MVVVVAVAVLVVFVGSEQTHRSRAHHLDETRGEALFDFRPVPQQRGNRSV